MMEWSRSVCFAGVAGVALGLGGALICRKISSGGDEAVARLSTSLEGLTAQLSAFRESVDRIEQLMREREEAGLVATDGLQLTNAAQSRSRSNASPVSMISAGFQSDAFDTAEEDHATSSDEDEDEDESSLETFLDRIDALHSRKENSSVTQKEAFDLLRDKVAEVSDDARLLWRFGRVHKVRGDLASASGDVEEQKRLIYAGLEYAKRAMELDECLWQAHQWYAILLGLIGPFESTQNKVSNGVIFKKHVDRAIELNSRDYSLHHLLAQYKYAVAGLTWIERNAAKMLYGEVPAATYEEAIHDFLEAERLNSKPWKNNKLMIAKCHYGLRQYAECREWLEKAKEVAKLTEEDEKSQGEIEALLAKL